MDAFDRITLADDSADPNCCDYDLETVYVIGCPGCSHRQEMVARQNPYGTLREALKELGAHLLGKG